MKIMNAYILNCMNLVLLWMKKTYGKVKIVKFSFKRGNKDPYGRSNARSCY